MPNTVVVGGGLAGLTAAAGLARQGQTVTLLEGAGATGGHARTTEHDGHLLNFGPHALGMSGPGTAVLRALGVALPGRLAPIAGSRLLVRNELLAPWHRDVRGSMRGAAAALRALARAPRRFDVTVGGWLDAEVDDPVANRFVRALAQLLTYADAADVQAVGALAASLRAGQPRYLDGGWQSIVTQLRQIVTDAGGRIVTGTPGRAVVIEHGRVVAVTAANGRLWPADAAVVAVGSPKQAAALLDGDAAATVAGWAHQAVPVALSSLDVALRQRPATVTGAVLGLDRPLYLAVHSDRARLAPRRGAVLHVAAFQQPGGPPASRHELEGLLDRVATDWRDQLVHARFLPSITVTHDLVVARSGSPGRPGPAVPGSAGLYVAGDWVGSAGYLAQASIASGAAAARAIVSGAVQPAAVVAG